MTNDSLEHLRQQIAAFAAERDWEQFHSPKNLAMALIGETAEVVEHFQWLTESQSDRLTAQQYQAVSYELADVLIYLIRLADRLNIDLIDAVQRKIRINTERYPIEKAKGKAYRVETDERKD